MNTQTSYDRVADEYVRRIFEELQHKPLDRQLLDRFAASVRDVGPACDMGCGPGHVARYLHERGVQVCGMDLSAEMVDRRLYVIMPQFRRLSSVFADKSRNCSKKIHEDFGVLTAFGAPQMRANSVRELF